MSPLKKLAIATPDTIRHDLLMVVEVMLKNIDCGEDVIDDVLEVWQLIDALPLSTSEYALAGNRLRNTHRYLESNERGAARYELALLAGSLRNGQSKSIAPKRRKHTGRYTMARRDRERVCCLSSWAIES